MSVVTKTFGDFRVEDLLKPGMPEKMIEIVEGELVHMSPAEWGHNRTALLIQILFLEFSRTHPDLKSGHDNDGFLLSRNPDNLRCPDASLFRNRPRKTKPWFDFAPEIAVEVKSPSNSWPELLLKMREYLDAGSEQVWIADPEKKSLDIYFADGRRVSYADGVKAVGEGIAEGLTIDLTEIFEGEE